MNLAEREADLLRWLARAPLADRLDLVGLTGWSRGSVYGGVARLGAAGLISSVPHSSPLVPPTRRFHLSAAGLRVLARIDGTDIGSLLDAHPVSRRWVRILLERLDAVAVIYRFASAVSTVAHPIGLRWYRAMPLDAAISLPSGRTVGVVRQGLTSGRTGFAKRTWRMRQDPMPASVFVLSPDPVRLRHARRLLSGGPAMTYLALEGDVAAAGARERVWRTPAGPVVMDLGTALAHLGRSTDWPAEEPLAGTSALGEGESDRPRHDRPDRPRNYLLPTMIGPADKRALDLLWDWPWITAPHLSGLMDVEKRTLSALLGRLDRLGLVCHADAGGHRRLALADRGLALLARRDRTSVGAARRRWSAEPADPHSPLTWRNVSGSGSRQLLRHIEHTDAVHWFLAALARQAREGSWKVVQLDPPRRASRYFSLGGRLRSVRPDAFGVLRRDGRNLPFFLEWERRAVRPVTMAARLAPYLRYYSSRRPVDDHGTLPSVLVVFEEELAAGQFLGVARENMRSSGVEVPVWVSHRDLLERVGPIGPAWTSPVHTTFPAIELL